ncbi:8-oxo-dGTP diphosphatase [Paenibacillus sp. H1-7]|uniref:NUDIX hydrolase n=1 Tax=Paenibacillus sp. H1-7 TaxID=2282849 RepID=UPI001EF7F5B6|nr:8-oxo-dGTP diphosphatase [Paenibacillus sp. H1-7]ULL19158.1 8-oxo-dGTP diphosphatase [Paenibacillus sp. H1-7]
MLKYNLCFIRKGSQLLMLNRHKAPLLGMWNGVGGKLEPGETPYDSVLREVYEETGIALTEARYGGIVTWEVDGKPTNGMYVYTAELPAKYASAYETPAETEEGILAWRPVEWIVHPDNQGVAKHVRHFLPPMLAQAPCSEYRCVFRNGRLISCTPLPLEALYAVSASGGMDAQP